MMMVEASDGSSVPMDGSFSFSWEVDMDDVVLDLDTLLDGTELPDYSQGGMSEDLPLVDYLKGEQNSDVLSAEYDLTGFDAQFMPHNSESSEFRKECSDGSLQNALSSGQYDHNKDPFEMLNHKEPFDFHGANQLIHSRGSLDLNDTDTAPFETSNYVEPSIFDGANHFIHKRDTSEASNLNYEEDLFGSTGYSGFHTFGNESENPYKTLSNGYQKIPSHIKVKLDTESITSGDIVNRANGVVNDVIGRKYYGGPAQLSSTEGIRWNTSNSLSSISCNNHVPLEKDEKEERNFEPKRPLPFPGRAGETERPASNSVVGNDWHPFSNVSENPGMLPLKVEANSIKMQIEMTNSAFVGHDWRPVVQVSEKPGILPPPSVKVQTNSLKMEIEMPNSALVGCDWRSLQVSEDPVIMPPSSVKEETEHLNMESEMPEFNDCHLSKMTYQEVQNNTGEQSDIDDDADVCILEDLSAPARSNGVAMNGKLVATSQFSISRDPVQVATTHSRFKPYDERIIFRAALQDLTQPKSEATPPDGFLSVPLLKHQRIALSWMVNKETKSACCSGGILADDQGLGKTISTIALILKERSPSSKGSKISEKQSETETLNLDDDDDGVAEIETRRVNGCSIKTSPPAKGRASGGTLIVCPTSVLRQWSEELHNKVTTEADLSVLVYYGSSRTKDPLELAKYDVVVTTYAIVSMEVPKQPVVNENENQMDSPFKDNSSCGKRKLLETNSCRSKKSRKGDDSESLENTYGPLAQVGWFRVVLDEAQSIKNHRTQVARACWGLRAKRRWCLSGTPIQNAIDDLYSYFRFLRHEPYAVFKTFCEQLKVPIHRNPKNGYKKLQAVLKTIMLRRTKGTYIDGEPIINLPPKKIELRKVDFSEEERGFYSRLEADSRAQFEEYAAAGTVKQNYVNILLMLLRLRQACDHPLLVKGFTSNSKVMSSIEMAKKLSREKQLSLLNCLEASLAICGICNDPPEDAVVTVCGHVFCSQCICQHIIGDGTQCPTKKCKTHLTMSCVFSITTLRIALSDQPPSSNNTAISNDSEVAEVSEPHSSTCPQDSSKIRAALEILLSLSVKREYASEKLGVSDTDSREDNRVSEMNKDSKSSENFVPEKAIVFSQWTGMLDLLEAGLKSTLIQYRRLDGTMTVAARDRAVKDFNTLPQVSVMIMSLKAASLGLNMVAACNVLLLDLWWNPTTEDQAIDRAHRIGQIRPVSVFRLTVKDTVEDRILALQQKKRKMVASAFGEDETGSRQTRLTVDDLKYLFRV